MARLYARTVLVWCLCGLCVLVASRAQADVSYFPVPSISSSRNDGSDAGFIVPTLITTPEGELRYVVAPMFIVNSIVGARGAINLFRYQPGGRELRFIASYTQEIERKVVFSYTDPAYKNGRYSVAYGASFFQERDVPVLRNRREHSSVERDELHGQGSPRQLEVRHLPE